MSLGRPPKPIFSYERSAGGFACLLRGARERAGDPNYRVMARHCDVSYSQLSKAANGERVPSWRVVAAFINSLNALSPAGVRESLPEWHERWAKAIEREGTETTARLRRRRARHARPSEPSIVPISADPTSATTAAEFVQQLKILQLWSHLSQKEISRRAFRNKTPLPTSTISDRLRSTTKLPSWSFVDAFVLACGGRKGDLAVWRDAWHNIRVYELFADAPTPVDGMRRVDKAMKLGPDRAAEQLAETVVYLKNALPATAWQRPDASQERPAWLQEVVEDKPISELETWFNTTWDDFRRGTRPGTPHP
ncbi:helix-turn-helix transcriptional regulator [Streptomyces sp. NBC_00083]|uniref:helix-turn-helix domain-containing protein n=1 Tax=Streptomyces sp. NBC_00083 TaxID=2975647 RepID=UPI002257DA60|nr:helix-turn-helix transcriptional regulator [Streptomyces sp. NBC_00083]MCX5386619.1 helix-turn-helix domain-containing protein [Streptomyces sp. NBC_00083]